MVTLRGMERSSSANVFVFYLAPSGAPAADFEERLRARASNFALPSRPYLDPALFLHRLLGGPGGAYAWGIEFQGLDLPSDEQGAGESLEQAVTEEVGNRLAGLAAITGVAGFVDLTVPAPRVGIRPPAPAPEGMSFDAGDEPAAWQDYATGSGTAQAGQALPSDAVGAVSSARDAVPVEPNLKPFEGGRVFAGSTDKDHLAYLHSYLLGRVERASAGDRRKIMAFLALQGREGSTAAINTYDNQIVTWGTGWGGLGWLGKVVERSLASEAVHAKFANAGLRYRSNNMYDVVDLTAGRVVTGKQDALQVIRASEPLLNLLIQAARDPETRDAVTEAQLLTFMEGSANISGSDAIATQALFTLVAHLKHWAPGYVVGVMEWAVPKIGDGSPSEDRDRALAPLIGRYFYGKAHTSKWIPDWRQFKLYWQQMKQDGLDCLADAFIQAAAPPTDDPFANDPPAAQAPAQAPKGGTLQHAPLAGVADLERVASGQAALRGGASGAGVKALQEALIQLGKSVPGGADGSFGPGVEAAVKAFQTEHGLGADGVVERGTLAALDAALG